MATIFLSLEDKLSENSKFLLFLREIKNNKLFEEKKNNR